MMYEELLEVELKNGYPTYKGVAFEEAELHEYGYKIEIVTNSMEYQWNEVHRAVDEVHRAVDKLIEELIINLIELIQHTIEKLSEKLYK